MGKKQRCGIHDWLSHLCYTLNGYLVIVLVRGGPFRPCLWKKYVAKRGKSVNDQVQKPLTNVKEDYLKAVLIIQEKQCIVRSVDVAHFLQVSKASVSIAVTDLRQTGHLTMHKDFSLHLTDTGLTIVRKIYERHCFFRDKLIAAGIDRQTADADACRIEHAISEESFQKLKNTF